jgi:hypothetical protein
MMTLRTCNSLTFSNSYSNVIARLDRAIKYSRGDSCLTRRHGVLDAPLSRGMTTENMIAHSRGAMHPGCAWSFCPERAQGMPGARCAAASRAIKNKAHEHSHHGHTGNRPAFPAQWF